MKSAQTILFTMLSFLLTLGTGLRTAGSPRPSCGSRTKLWSPPGHVTSIVPACALEGQAARWQGGAGRGATSVYARGLPRGGAAADADGGQGQSRQRDDGTGTGPEGVAGHGASADGANALQREDDSRERDQRADADEQAPLHSDCLFSPAQGLAPHGPRRDTDPGGPQRCGPTLMPSSSKRPRSRKGSGLGRPRVGADVIVVGGTAMGGWQRVGGVVLAGRILPRDQVS